MIPKEYQAFEKSVSVAAVNFQAIWGNKEATIKKMKGKVIDAVNQGCDIVVFPELALTGYECDGDWRNEHRPCQMHRDLAEVIPGTSTNEMSKLAKDYGIYIIFGMPEQDTLNKDIRYISSVVLGPNGIIGVYRKLHLAPSPMVNEPYCFTRGSQLPIFNTKYGPIGVLICYDFLSCPELSCLLALKGARLIINTTASSCGPRKPDFLVCQTVARATENAVYTVSANLVGKERSISYHGHSLIAGPYFERRSNICAEAEEYEEIVSATLSFDRLHYLHYMQPWKKIRQSDLILREFQTTVVQDETFE